MSLSHANEIPPAKTHPRAVSCLSVDEFASGLTDCLSVDDSPVG
jgi:hypothetical protein